MLELGPNWYFMYSMVSQNVCKEYLNTARVKMSLLLLINSWTFWYMERLHTWSYMQEL